MTTLRNNTNLGWGSRFTYKKEFSSTSLLNSLMNERLWIELKRIAEWIVCCESVNFHFHSTEFPFNFDEGNNTKHTNTRTRKTQLSRQERKCILCQSLVNDFCVVLFSQSSHLFNVTLYFDLDWIAFEWMMWISKSAPSNGPLERFIRVTSKMEKCMEVVHWHLLMEINILATSLLVIWS